MLQKLLLTPLMQDARLAVIRAYRIAATVSVWEGNAWVTAFGSCGLIVRMGDGQRLRSCTRNRRDLVPPSSSDYRIALLNF